MTLLAGFLDVMLRGLGLVALAAAVGGVAYALWGLRPLGSLSPVGATSVTRALRLIVAASATLAASQAVVVLLLHPWALADEAGQWPMAAIDFARAGLVRIALSVGLAIAAVALGTRPASRGAWPALCQRRPDPRLPGVGKECAA